MNSDKYRNIEEAKRAYARLQHRVEEGSANQRAAVDKVANMVIVDKLIRPSEMIIHPEGFNLKIEYTRQPQKFFSIHPHALSQLASKDRVKIPMEWVNRHLKLTEDWRTSLVADVFTKTYANTDFKGKQDDDPKFLHRIVGDQLRGFVSRRFNRHLASGKLLSSFISVCLDMGAVPVEGTATDVKVALKCALPAIFEPVRGEFVALGVEWGNSDFGAGRMQVSLFLWTASGDRFTVLEHSMFKRHLGSVIEDSEVEISEETATKEAEAQASAIRDTVREQLSEANIDKILRVVELAHAEEITWDKIKGQLSRFIGQDNLKTLKDALDNDILDLPPVKKVDNERIPTKWWATQAISWLASRTSDPEKKLELERVSSTFLEVKNA